MPAKRLFLSWKDHNGALVSVFESLLKKNALVDCTLAAEGQYLKAHKVVLSACSSYFELLFSQESEKNPIVILKDVKFQELEAAVNFMYRGEVEVCEDRLPALLEVAESLQIKGLGNGGESLESEATASVRSSGEEGVQFEENPMIKTEPVSGTLVEDRSDEADIYSVYEVTVVDDQVIWDEHVTETMEAVPNNQQDIDYPLGDMMTEESMSENIESMQHGNKSSLIGCSSEHIKAEESTPENDVPPLSEAFSEGCPSEHIKAEDSTNENVAQLLSEAFSEGCPSEHIKAEENTLENDVQPLSEAFSEGYPTEHIQAEDSTCENDECMQTLSEAFSEGYASEHINTEDSTCEKNDDMQLCSQSISDDHTSVHKRTEESICETVKCIQPGPESVSDDYTTVHKRTEESICEKVECIQPDPETASDDYTSEHMRTEGTEDTRENAEVTLPGSQSTSKGLDYPVTEEHMRLISTSVLLNDPVTDISCSNVSVKLDDITLLSTSLQPPSKKCFRPNCEEDLARTMDLKRQMRLSQSRSTLPCGKGSELSPEHPSVQPRKLQETDRESENSNSLQFSEYSYVTTNRDRSKRHHWVLKEENSFKCQHCEYASTYKTSLVKHNKTHAREKPFKCEHCVYESAQKGNLLRHLRRHTGEKPYKCPHCNYVSAQKIHIVIHMRTHTGEKPFKCSHCDYVSTHKVSLAVHLRKHTGENPFKCIHCDYTCRLKSDLQQHLGIHAVEKPFKCIHCDYMCRLKSNLQQHLSTHAVEKPFKCLQCDYACVRKSYLRNHLRTHTGGKVLN